MLYVVPTPIGNLQDITLRALETLRNADLVYAEDTRTTKKLLDHFEIQANLQSLHIHNEHQRVPQYVEQIKSLSLAALVSVAGTPGISDPGYLLIRACLDAGIPVTALPGPTAFVPALVASGLPCDRFHFEGFLPKKKGRRTRLEFLKNYLHTFILYESPFRVQKTVSQIVECMPDRMISISRELTKMHEETITGSGVDVLTQVNDQMTLKGEFVIVVGPRG